MTAIARRATFHQALEAFATTLEKYTETSDVDGSEYVRISALSEWMRGHTQWEDRYISRTQLLANAAYSGWKDFPPTICDEGKKCCVVVFSILLDLGLGHRISEFTKRGIVDSNLPQDLATLKTRLNPLGLDSEDLANKFNERQWKFSPAQFSYDMDEEFFENRVIPVCRKTHLNSGGTANVWQIVVQEEFVDSKLRSFLAGDMYAKYDDRDFGMCYIFALKTFESNFQYYNDEKTAFDGLQHNKGVIRRLGCYSHRVRQAVTIVDPNTHNLQQTCTWKDTMNILLEYGNFDLRLYFGHISPPVLPAEIIRFWKSIFEVGDAVYGIHEFKQGGSEYNGWHADIKPENIIVVRGKYKLADPGFARFKKAAQGKSAAPPEILVHGGTDTYGAPEGRNGTTVHQTIDTWSLGCVFSVAASWVIMGWDGIVLYSKVREKALERVLRDIKDNGHPLLASRKLSVGSKPEKMDCFHNGSDVLREVHEWHQLLRKSARKTDPLTEQVLDLIDRKMLLKKPHERIRSKDLCIELGQLVKSANKAAKDSAATDDQVKRQSIERMEAMLSVIDKEAEAIAAPVQLPPEPSCAFERGLPVNRGALKVQLQNATMKKTSHRFETIAATHHHDRGSTSPMPAIVASDTHGPQQVLQGVNTQPTDLSALSDRRLSHRKTNSASGASTAPPSRNGNDANPTHAYQNVIQARERMERKRKEKRTLGMITGKKRQKDDYLSKYFKKRDIKFLVDDSESMAEHWDEATFVLETLVMKAYGQDPDGMDLLFTNEKSGVTKAEDASQFRKAMQKARPKDQVHTNMKEALTRMFNAYLGTLQYANKGTVNSLTIVVLSDGLWVGMNDQNEMEGKIVEFHNALEKVMDGMRGTRQVSIQFIQFGDNEEAKERLRRLDDDMPYRGVEDMIDFESFSIKGNVFKMLLGSFVEKFDAIKDSTEDLSLAPGQHDSASMYSTSTNLLPPNSPPMQLSRESTSRTTQNQNVPVRRPSKNTKRMSRPW